MKASKKRGGVLWAKGAVRKGAVFTALRAVNKRCFQVKLTLPKFHRAEIALPSQAAGGSSAVGNNILLSAFELRIRLPFCKERKPNIKFVNAASSQNSPQKANSLP